jgi:ABC-type multidrug transport system fused ATPase/permease subunit
LEPVSGRIYADGVDIRDIPNWTKQFGYVPQEIFLVDDTIRRNVAIGLADELVDQVALDRAIKMAQLENFISGLPDGLDSVVGEFGVRLSGGQRQRIGIARSLYRDPSILVFDEATSALDVRTENRIVNTIKSFGGDKTVVIVAHQRTATADCDYLLRIDDGTVEVIDPEVYAKTYSLDATP